MKVIESILLFADLGVLKSVATLMLFLFFAGLIVWLGVSPSARFSRVASMPLDEDDEAGRGPGLDDEGAPQA